MNEKCKTIPCWLNPSNESVKPISSWLNRANQCAYHATLRGGGVAASEVVISTCRQFSVGLLSQSSAHANFLLMDSSPERAHIYSPPTECVETGYIFSCENEKGFVSYVNICVLFLYWSFFALRGGRSLCCLFVRLWPPTSVCLCVYVCVSLSLSLSSVLCCEQLMDPSGDGLFP